MTHSLTLRALARLLSYPDAHLLATLPDIGGACAEAAGLSFGARGAVVALITELLGCDTLEAEARYVDTFDRGRRTSLHLFEHVHGDSRERGPAMIDLRRSYEAAGLFLADGELPDFLPVVLEFASTQPPQTAHEFLGEMTHILNALHRALIERDSRYACVVAAVLELAGEVPHAVALADEQPLDASWAEPEAFGGCNSAGQQAPGQPQPVHIVRPASSRQTGAVA